MSKLTKADLQFIIKDLEAQLASKQEEIDMMNEDYIHNDTVGEMITEAIEEHEEEKLRKLARRYPEDNRAEFRCIQGGAA